MKGRAARLPKFARFVIYFTAARVTALRAAVEISIDRGITG